MSPDEFENTIQKEWDKFKENFIKRLNGDSIENN